MKVYIENIFAGSDMVTVYDYDSSIQADFMIEVCPRNEAFKKYDVVGELVNGELTLFEDSEDKEDYSDFSDLEEED